VAAPVLHGDYMKGHTLDDKKYCVTTSTTLSAENFLTDADTGSIYTTQTVIFKLFLQPTGCDEQTS